MGRDRSSISAQMTRSPPGTVQKAIPPALDINQPTIFFAGEVEGQRPNPVTDGSSGVGPIPGIEPQSSDPLGAVPA